MSASKPVQCMTTSVDRRKSTDAHDAMKDLKEVKINTRDSHSAVQVMNRVNALFNQHKGTEILLVRDAHQTLDRVRNLMTKVEAESVAIKARRARAVQDFEYLNATDKKPPSRKPGERTLPPPSECNTTVEHINRRPLSRELMGSAIGQRILRPGSPSRRPQTSPVDPGSSLFGAHQRHEWNQMRAGQWRPSTPSIIPQLKADPRSPMNLASQLHRFRGSEKHSEHLVAQDLRCQSQELTLQEPETAGRPLVANRLRYREAVKSMMKSLPEPETRPKTAAGQILEPHLRHGIVRDRHGHTAVKVHNAWITRFNSSVRTISR